jgi:hypothetical protein
MACQSRPLRDKLRARLRVFVMKMKHLRQCRLASYSTKSKNAHRNREYGLKVMKSMTDDDFQRMFRVTRAGFQKLCDGISLRLSIDILQARRSSGSHISLTARLAATLRWLGGGSHWDICALFGLDFHNFFNVKHGPLWRTIEILDEMLVLGFSVKKEVLRRTAEDFSKFSNGRMKGCVMAVDGWVCATRTWTII